MKGKMSWLLSIVMLLAIVLSACGSGATTGDGSTTTNTGGEETTSQAEPAQIDVAFLTFNKIPEPDALQSVEAAIDAITVPEINATVKLHPYSIAEYFQNVTLALQAGDSLDVYVSLGDLPQRVANNEFVDITGLIDEYAPEAKEIVGDAFLSTATLNGNLYGIPAFKGLALAPSLIYRADIMEEIGVDPASITSLEDLTDLFAKVKEAYPDMIPLVPVNPGSIGLINALHGVDFLGDSYLQPIAVLEGDSTEVVNFYQTDTFKHLVDLARSWFEAGYVLKDAATTTGSATEFMSSGQGFSYVAAYSGYQAYNQLSAQMGQEIRMLRLNSPYLSTSSVNGLTWGVSTTSSSPEQALQFINMMFSNKDVINLIIWGIEGRDYVVVDEYHAAYPEGEDFASVPYTAQLSNGIVGNQFIQYQVEGADINDLNIMLDENVNSDMSPVMGFTFEGSGVANEYTAVINVIDQYLPGLITGSVDPAEIENFNAKLEAAGINTIVEAKQQQLDAWLAAQN